MRFLITGTAGFIGFHLARRLLAEGHFVTGFDGMTHYYDVRLKQARHAQLRQTNRFNEVIGLLEDVSALERAAELASPEIIIHLAAQAGVRHSIENPRNFIDSNVTGSFNVLEVARAARVRHLLMASTSSVYGANTKLPFQEIDKADTPITPYAASKKAMELMSHAFSHLWEIPTTCFRFFTVYGPWGRPDMALFKFVDAIQNDRPIEVYGHGRMRRDFTYIDDLIEAIIRLIAAPPAVGEAAGPEDSLSNVAAWRLVNIAGGEPVELMAFIDALEQAMGKKAQRLMRPMQPGDMVSTGADPSLLEAVTGYLPTTTVQKGVKAFVDWYQSEYRPLMAKAS
ncbi:MAG TPA: NAD-dependent epimerase/dehydratase family protein [Bosea sp. (in: a-proteobacteria)]